MGSEAGFVSQDIIDQVKVGRDWVAAEYGFRNHWYVAALSEEVKEGEPIAVQVCGEKVLLNRIDGKVYCIKDQCIHKGVPFSEKIECYSKGTISCWYHGFTFRFDSGDLVGVLGSPESNVIGRKKIKTYPIQEAKNAVFIFIGDDVESEDDLPPLHEDLPPGFLDDGYAVFGRSQEVKSNWRIGCENGFDSTHIFIHKDSTWVKNGDLALPLGLVPKNNQSFPTQEDEGGPKGVFDLFDPDHVTPAFEGTVEGETVLMGNVEGKNLLPHTISMWMPGILRVDPWPAHGLTQYEFYVPIDGERHTYFQFLRTKAETEEEVADFKKAFDEKWVPEALIAFNQDDVWAREASQEFYADSSGFLREQLFEADGNVIKWRHLADKYNRGIQGPEHVR